MKKVLSITANGEFKQYLMLSETRYLKQMCEEWGRVTVEIVKISIAKYKIYFGK